MGSVNFSNGWSGWKWTGAVTVSVRTQDAFDHMMMVHVMKEGARQDVGKVMTKVLPS